MASLVRRIASRQVRPGGAGAKHPEHAIQNVARVTPWTTSLGACPQALWSREGGTDGLPLLLSEIHHNGRSRVAICRRSPAECDRIPRTYIASVMRRVLVATPRRRRSCQSHTIECSPAQPETRAAPGRHAAKRFRQTSFRTYSWERRGTPSSGLDGWRGAVPRPPGDVQEPGASFPSSGSRVRIPSAALWNEMESLRFLNRRSQLHPQPPLAVSVLRFLNRGRRGPSRRV